MDRSRLLMLLAAVATAAGSLSTLALAQNTAATPPADLQPPIKLDTEAWRAQLVPDRVGLKPRSGALEGIELPLGIRYSREAKGVAVPLGEKSDDWHVGVGLNLNSSTAVELSPSSSVGLQAPLPRTPGIMFQKKF